MTTAAILKYLAAASACGATAAAVQGSAGSAQDWTVLGLLAAVVLGIGARMVAATEKNTNALFDVKSEMHLLAQKLREDRRVSERIQSETKSLLEALANAITQRERDKS